MRVIERFGRLLVPTLDGVQRPNGNGETPRSAPLFSGGGYDLYGGERMPRGARMAEITGVIYGGTRASRQAQISAWEAAGGTIDRLFARTDDDVVVWQWARLVPPNPRASYAQPDRTEIDLTWLIYGDTWNGLRHGNGLDLDHTPPEGFDEGLVLDYDGSDWDTEYILTGSPFGDINLKNGGNTIQTVAVIDIIPGTAAITDVVFPSGGHSWHYTGTIGGGQHLVVHTGNSSVRLTTETTAGATSGDDTLAVTSSASFVDGQSIAIALDDGSTHYTTIADVPDGTHVEITDPLPTTVAIGNSVGVGTFADFEEPAGQMEWLKLLPGDNDLEITYTGGGTNPKVKVDFYDSWA